MWPQSIRRWWGAGEETQPQPLERPGIPETVRIDVPYRVSPDISTQAVEQGLVLVDIGTGTTFRLNPSGKQVWEQLQQGRTVAEIICRMHDVWGVSLERVEADIRHLVENLFRAGLLVSHVEPPS
jgi:hypothetical protein